ncbi:MAG: CoA transferase, partial [Bryobacterales bacterium]|nr:CoA transferase [Bryobacterales bacterium]
MQGVLDGVRVLDFGRFIAGPWCAALLGDFGADVIRVEKIDGGEDRFISKISDKDGAGAMFLQVNRNKRCLTLDPTTAEGRDIQQRLISTADIVVANMPQRALEKLGLDYASLTAVRPDIILVSNTCFGTTGPYGRKLGFDGLAQAMCGNMHLTGTPEEPMKSYSPWVDFGT